MEYFLLNNGNQLPAIGLGTFPMRRNVLDHAVYHYIKGNNSTKKKLLLDSARDYGNESDLGKSLSVLINQGKIKRENLFITTKIGNRQQMSHEQGIAIAKDIERSLSELNEYIDLLLMHWPLPGLYEKTWNLMGSIYQSGLAKNIGVCIFSIRHLTRLLRSANIIPAVNQIEIHLLQTADEDIAFCKSRGIQLQAYSLDLTDDRIRKSSVLNQIANRYNKNAPQIVLRWDFQKGVASIPKSSTPEQIENNFDIFDYELSKI